MSGIPDIPNLSDYLLTHPVVLKYSRRSHATPEESLSLAYFAFLKCRDSYEPVRGEWEPFLSTCLRNAFIDEYRRQTAHRSLPISPETEVYAATVDPPAASSIIEETEAVQEALSKIAPFYSKLLTLHYFKHYTYQELADFYHVPIGTIKSRLYTARQLLSSHLKD